MFPDTFIDAKRIKAAPAGLSVNDTFTLPVGTQLCICVISINCNDRAHEDFIIY